jgi:hypothetical protein
LDESLVLRRRSDQRERSNSHQQVLGGLPPRSTRLHRFHHDQFTRYLVAREASNGISNNKKSQRSMPVFKERQQEEPPVLLAVKTRQQQGDSGISNDDTAKVPPMSQEPPAE